ncbi:MAG: hypothetical protein ACM36C_01205 [Acidobacteriota bacterium]
MHVRVGQVALIVLASAAAACTHPSSNEINVSDEGMKEGVAAARYLTPVALDSLELGRSLDVDKSIKDATTSFKPQDTVCASIKVSGSANSGLVRAVWTDQNGKAVQDDTRIVTPSRSDTVALQVTPPTGWTGGQYRLDVYLDDRLAATRNFTVEGGETPANQQKAGEKPGPANH